MNLDLLRRIQWPPKPIAHSRFEEDIEGRVVRWLKVVAGYEKQTVELTAQEYEELQLDVDLLRLSDWIAMATSKRHEVRLGQYVNGHRYSAELWFAPRLRGL